MKKLIILMCFFGLGLGLHAQEDAGYKNWLEYMTPSATHKFIAKYDGNWKTTAKMWAAPDQEPEISTGTAKSEMILEGRYQLTNFDAQYGGMPLTGISYLAYDNAKQQFISTWIDNFGTGIMILYGTWDDENKKSILFEGNMVDPTTGEDTYVKQVYTYVDDNTQLMEMYADSGQGEFKTMEIKFERVK